ncbi:hypothetical protein R8510_05395 [Ralstonia chuxiongensis]|nr:hypothetical protein R8510_05395 [Ralstonia chuxiongensis]
MRIKFDQLGLQLGDVAQGRIPRSGIVYRDTHARATQRAKRVPQGRIVVDLRMFRDLHHDALQWYVVQNRFQLTTQNGRGRRIERQICFIRAVQRWQRFANRQRFELHPQPHFVGVGKPAIWRHLDG